LKQRYDSPQNKLFLGLSNKTQTSIAIDCWGGSNWLSFLGITCYYISNNWQLRESLLGFEPVVGSHRGQNLSQIVNNVLRNHNLSGRLLAVAADNASNNSTI
jgi:hypothetical protein